MAHDVFISYSTKDKPTADAVCATLEVRGLRCWIAPRDILPGMDWGEAIIRAISTSRVMILIFSSNANSSKQIKREVDRAVNKEVPILPFRIEPVEPSEALEYYLGTPHWLDALTLPIEKHIDHLAASVRQIIEILDQRPARPQPEEKPPETNDGRSTLSDLLQQPASHQPAHNDFANITGQYFVSGVASGAARASLPTPAAPVEAQTATNLHPIGSSDRAVQSPANSTPQLSEVDALRLRWLGIAIKIHLGAILLSVLTTLIYVVAIIMAYPIMCVTGVILCAFGIVMRKMTVIALGFMPIGFSLFCMIVVAVFFPKPEKAALPMAILILPFAVICGVLGWLALRSTRSMSSY